LLTYFYLYPRATPPKVYKALADAFRAALPPEASPHEPISSLLKITHRDNC
jgi:hypothetical protein